MNSLVQVMVAVSAVISAVALVLGCFLGYALLFAPPPETMTMLPVRIASNPADSDHWDFGDPRPELHAGDQLIADFHVCFFDAFGGKTVSIQSQRSLVSFDGTVRAPLPPMAIISTVGCRNTHSLIGQLPDKFPDGTYRVEGSTLAYTDHYSRTLQWNSVWFDVVSGG